jgi:hypothetical protein
LTEIVDGFLPHLTSKRVVGEAFGVFGEPLGMETLDALDRPGVERAPAILEETSVRHRVGVGSGEPGLGLPALGGQGRGAPTTELFAGLVGEPAGGAGGGEWRRTLSAEAASRSILGVAPGTLHAGAPPLPERSA